MITREVDFSTKEEENTNDHNKISKPNSASSSTSWSRLKDPRIVRVSRAFGGKDRHSKVCTVRGLRDRRVRLSVPTAIQLYDLQDRLGLNQPSKVVDWLLNAAKHEIDDLPPLQMPPGNFPQNLHTMFGIGNPNSQSDKGLHVMDSDETMRDSSKDVDQETTNEKDQDCNNLDHNHHHGGYVSSNNFFQRSNQNPNQNQNQNHASLAGLLNNTMSYSSFLRWDPSNLSLSHGGTTTHGLPPQPEEFRNFNMASGSSQVVVYPHGVVQSYFPSNISATEFEPKHMNLQMLSSNSQNPNSLTQSVDSSSQQPVRPFHFSMMANLLPSHNNDGSDRGNKDDHDFDSR